MSKRKKKRDSFNVMTESLICHRSEMICYDIGMGRLLSESGVYLVVFQYGSSVHLSLGYRCLEVV